MALPVTQGLQNDQVAQKHPLLERRSIPPAVRDLARRLGKTPEEVAARISPDMLRRLGSEYVAYERDDGTTYFYRNIAHPPDSIQSSVGVDRGEGVVSLDVLKAEAEAKAEKSSTKAQEAPGADDSLVSAPGRDSKGRFLPREKS